MTHDPRLDGTRPVQIHDLLGVRSPEEFRCTGETAANLSQVMSLAEKVCQSEAYIKSRIAEVNHFVVKQNQLFPVDECVLRAEIAAHQTVFVAERLPCQGLEKVGRLGNVVRSIKVVRFQTETLEVGCVGKFLRYFEAGLRRTAVNSAKKKSELFEMVRNNTS